MTAVLAFRCRRTRAGSNRPEDELVHNRACCHAQRGFTLVQDQSCSLCHISSYYPACIYRMVFRARRARLLTSELANQFQPSSGGIGRGYLADRARARAKCYTNGKAIAIISDAGYYLEHGRNATSVRVQKLDVVTDVTHRRKGHGTAVMVMAIRSLVHPSPPPPPAAAVTITTLVLICNCAPYSQVPHVDLVNVGDIFACGDIVNQHVIGLLRKATDQLGLDVAFFPPGLRGEKTEYMILYANMDAISDDGSSSSSDDEGLELPLVSSDDDSVSDSSSDSDDDSDSDSVSDGGADSGTQQWWVVPQLFLSHSLFSNKD